MVEYLAPIVTDYAALFLIDVVLQLIAVMKTTAADHVLDSDGHVHFDQLLVVHMCPGGRHCDHASLVVSRVMVLSLTKDDDYHLAHDLTDDSPIHSAAAAAAVVGLAFSPYREPIPRGPLQQ